MSSIQFHLTSELNAPTTAFTLTCTSTGGPATNVFWTVNNSAVIEDSTYSITSQVTDTVKATYNHTLTVTEKLVGEYQCSVSNNKPSSSSGMLAVVGKNYFHHNVSIYFEKITQHVFSSDGENFLVTPYWSFTRLVPVDDDERM